MGDPFSITAGAIGISEVALSGMSRLRQVVIDIRDAPQEIKDIRFSLEATQVTLTSLENLRVNDAALSERLKATLKQTALEKTINKCGEVSGQFARDLDKWTARSSDTKMSTRDRMLMPRRRAKIERCKTQVTSCQTLVALAMESAQLIVQYHCREESEVAHRNTQTQMQAFESRLTERIRDVEQRRQTLEDQSKVVDSGESGDEAERSLAAFEAAEQASTLEDLQVSCGVLGAQMRSARTGQTIREVVTEKNSQAFVGMPESVVGKIEQSIANVRTTDGSVAHVGVFTNSLDFTKLGARP